MSNASNYLEEQIGAHLLRTASWTKPSALYVALFTTMPAEDGTGGVEVEVSGTGYDRVQRDPGDANWNAPTGGNGQFSNAAAVQFGSPTASWGSVVGFGLFDASTAGNYLIGATFSSPVAVADGDPAPAFATGALTVTVA